MEKTDISKQTVLVLLVLTLVVSIVGTWTILSTPTTLYKTVEQGGPQNGKVNLEIRPPLPYTESNAEAKVAINILK